MVGRASGNAPEVAVDPTVVADARESAAATAVGVRTRAEARRRRRRVLAVAAAALVVLLALLAMRAPRVPVAAATRRELVQRVVATGRVAPPARVSIGTLVLGQVARVAVEEGAQVHVGDLLAELDDAEARATVLQAEATVAAAEARLDQQRRSGNTSALEALKQARIRVDLAAVKRDRLAALVPAGSAASGDLQDAENALALARSEVDAAAVKASAASERGSDTRQAVAGVAQARAALAAAQARLAQLRITAPVDGVVLTRAVEPGDIVQPGKTLFALGRAGKTLLVVNPDEKSLGVLRAGLAARASADAFPGRSFGAVVSFIAPAVDPQRGTIEVKLEVPEPPEFLRADMTVSVDIEAARKPDALVLPTEAVRRDPGGADFVLRARGGRVERTPVTVGLRGERSVEIAQGLSEGDLALVGDPAPELGARVRPTLP